MLLSGCRPAVLRAAASALAGLTEGFRHWLGPPSGWRWTPTPAASTGGTTWSWSRKGSPPTTAGASSAVKETAFLREACFLFFGQTLRLSDIPPAGVWVRPWSERSSAAVYRLTVQTRLQVPST